MRTRFDSTVMSILLHFLFSQARKHSWLEYSSLGPRSRIAAQVISTGIRSHHRRRSASARDHGPHLYHSVPGYLHGPTCIAGQLFCGTGLICIAGQLICTDHGPTWRRSGYLHGTTVLHRLSGYLHGTTVYQPSPVRFGTAPGPRSHLHRRSGYLHGTTVPPAIVCHLHGTTVPPVSPVRLSACVVAQ